MLHNILTTSMFEILNFFTVGARNYSEKIRYFFESKILVYVEKVSNYFNFDLRVLNYVKSTDKVAYNKV